MPVPGTEAMEALTPPQVSWVRRNLHTVMLVLTLLAALCLRELLVRYHGIPHYLIPSPRLVATTLVRDFVSIEGSMWFTMKLDQAAMGLAIVGGILIGIFFVLSRKVEMNLFPFKVVLQATPVAAIAFLVCICVSNTFAALLICACIAAFIPILTSTVIGLRRADRDLRDLFAQYGAIPWQRVRCLQAPSANPDFLAELEVAGMLLLIGAVVAEFAAGAVGQDTGLVSRILESSFRDETHRMIAVPLLASLPVIVVGLITSWLSNPVLVHRHETGWKTEG